MMNSGIPMRIQTGVLPVAVNMASTMISDSVTFSRGACARNRIAVLVPCHRVVRGDGSVGGYRWGLPLKRRLLQREGARLAGGA